MRRSSTDWGILAPAAAQHCAKTQAKAMAKAKSTLAAAKAVMANSGVSRRPKWPRTTRCNSMNCLPDAAGLYFLRIPTLARKTRVCTRRRDYSF